MLEQSNRKPPRNTIETLDKQSKNKKWSLRSMYQYPRQYEREYTATAEHATEANYHTPSASIARRRIEMAGKMRFILPSVCWVHGLLVKPSCSSFFAFQQVGTPRKATAVVKVSILQRLLYCCSSHRDLHLISRVVQSAGVLCVAP